MIVGFKLWVNNHPKPDDCVIITVSLENWLAASRNRGKLGAEVRVTDIRTGRRYILKRSECGLPGCNCALRIARELPRTTPRRAQTRLVWKRSVSALLGAVECSTRLLPGLRRT